VNNPLDVKKMSMLLTLLLTCLTSFGLHWTEHAKRLMLFSQNAYLIIVRVSVILFTRFAQNLIHTLCRIQE
jgi:hypothetical protein